MRKPSEIIQLGYCDPRYNPTNMQVPFRTWRFLCNMLNQLLHEKEITNEEYYAATKRIAWELRGYHSLITYFTGVRGYKNPSREQFDTYWAQLVYSLQSRGL